MRHRKRLKMRLALGALAAAALPASMFGSCGNDLSTAFQFTPGTQYTVNGVVHQAISITNMGPTRKGNIYLALENLPAGVTEAPYTWTSTCELGAQFIRIYLGADNQWVSSETKTLMLNFYNASMPVNYRYRLLDASVLPSPHVVAGDYDGDRLADLALHNQTTGYWTIKQSTNSQVISKLYGNPFIDHSVIGDFDGDLKEDFALYRPSVGAWLIIRSSDNQAMQLNLGTPNVDIPVPADYDGDGYTDIAVFNPNTAVYTIRQSTNGQVITKQFGTTSDVPVPADYDGDGHADLAIFRPSNHTFYILLSGINQVFTYTNAGFKGAVPFAADVNGDGRADLCTYNANNGKITIAYFTGGANLATQTVDMAAKSILVVNDFSGDFKADAATYDWGTSYWAVNSQLTAVGPVPVASFQFGSPNDIPVMTIPAMLW